MLRLFYFSGTGNARSVAHWIASEWQERGRDVQVVDLAKIDARGIRLVPDDEVGLASPTHGFNYPPITLKFLWSFPRAPKRNRVFIINTRAGVRVFGIYLPGLSGVAQLWAAAVFWAKGYRVVGMRPIDLPSNWISIHPGLRADNVRAIHQRCEVLSRRFARRMLDGNREMRALWDLPQDLLIAPISLGYYVFGRFLFAKSFYASAACDACGACIKQCPVQAIQWVRGRPFWSYRCESCMRCMNQCPRRAIETAHGFIVACSLLASLVMTAWIHPTVARLVPWWFGRTHGVEAARFVLESVVSLALLFFAYRVLHWGLRWRIVERFIVLTSLTHFAFWRRYRPAKNGVGCAVQKSGPRGDTSECLATGPERPHRPAADDPRA